ncbi:MAG: AsmA family protein, partial [Acidobacteriota bacterium]
MKRLLKWSAAVVALLLVALAALPFLIDANRFRPLLEQQLSQSLGRKVTIGDLSLAVLSGGVAASDLSIAEDPAFGSRPFLSAKSVKIGVDLRALIFSRQLKVQDVTVNGADVALQQNPEGAWNFSSLGATKSTAAAAPVPPPVSPEAPLSLTVGLVRIQDARITLSATDGSTEARGFKDVNFELRNFSTSTAMPFSLQAASTGGGTLKLTGNAGPLASAKTEQTPFDAQIDISKLDLAKSGFTSPASGLAGLLTFKGSANSNGATAAIKGALILDDLRLSKTGKPAPRPVALNIALVHDLNKRRGEVARSIVKLGSASATLTGSYNLAADPPSIDAKLSGPNMPLTELAAFLPMFDIVLPAGATISSGTASLDVTSKGSFVRLNTVGSVKLEKAQLANYDLGSKL